MLPGDGVEASPEDRRSDVTPRRRHAGDGGPVVGSDVVDLDRVQVRNTIKASHDVDVVVE